MERDSSVFVDWIADPHLDRKRVTRGTAAILRMRMRHSGSLILRARKLQLPLVGFRGSLVTSTVSDPATSPFFRSSRILVTSGAEEIIWASIPPWNFCRCLAATAWAPSLRTASDGALQSSRDREFGSGFRIAAGHWEVTALTPREALQRVCSLEIASSALSTKAGHSSACCA